MPFASLGGRGVPMFCPEAITLLFTMVRSIMNMTSARYDIRLFIWLHHVDQKLSWPLTIYTLIRYSAVNLANDITNYPNVIIQFLFYIYNNVPDYMTVFMTPDVLNAMVACFFPCGTSSEINSESNTPVDDAKVTLHHKYSMLKFTQNPMILHVYRIQTV